MEFPKRDVISVPPVVTAGKRDVPSAPYGYSHDILNNAAAPQPPTYLDDTNDHCNILPPPPRSQIYPPKCGNLKKPFKRGDLYLTYSPTQGTAGLTSGGSDNANWVRGNEFADNYDQKRFSNAHLHRKEINVGKIIQTNPLYVANSPFYPQPNSCIKKDKWHMTYPHFPEYSKNGQPIFYGDPAQQPTLFLGKDRLDNKLEMIEGFGLNMNDGSKEMRILVVVIGIIFLFMILMKFRK